MWGWIVAAAAVLAAGVFWRIARRATPDRDLDEFLERLISEIRGRSADYEVRGVVSGSFTMVVSVRGQDVPVPLDNIFRHYLMYPEQLGGLVRQLLTEIEEVGLERPEDRLFSDSAMHILPQISRRDWVFDHAPAFGPAALVHREFGPDLLLCYVIDDPFSVVFVCKEHIDNWGRTEEDLFHLANQNLHRLAASGLPDVSSGPVRVAAEDGYGPERLLLLDPEAADDLLVALPTRDSIYLGRETDRDELVSLLAREDRDDAVRVVGSGLYRFDGRRLVLATAPDPESDDPGRTDQG